LSAVRAECHRRSDAALVGRVAATDRAAFEELYDRHSQAAFSLARSMLEQAPAEAVVGEAFASVWENAAAYDAGRGPVGLWLLGIVRTLSIERLRRLDVGDRRRVGVAWAAGPWEGRGPGARDERGGGGPRTMSDALAALPEDERAVVKLAYFGGLTNREIAEQLDVDVDTVKRRTHLGLAKLRAATGAFAPNR
jgi:DNA-directed RNA polymerase specialized sigma24 family protein